MIQVLIQSGMSLLVSNQWVKVKIILDISSFSSIKTVHRYFDTIRYKMIEAKKKNTKCISFAFNKKNKISSAIHTSKHANKSKSHRSRTWLLNKNYEFKLVLVMSSKYSSTLYDQKYLKTCFTLWSLVKQDIVSENL